MGRASGTWGKGILNKGCHGLGKTGEKQVFFKVREFRIKSGKY